MEARESWTPCFSCRSLLLSTTLLNDYVANVVKFSKAAKFIVLTTIWLAWYVALCDFLRFLK